MSSQQRQPKVRDDLTFEQVTEYDVDALSAPQIMVPVEIELPDLPPNPGRGARTPVVE